MAKGGSGDVLTGMLTSQLAQGYNPLHACIVGVFLHGSAGDFAAFEMTEETMTASDIISHFSNAYKYLKS
jgi:NAD(P)H-hydrate epimerase